MMLKLETWVSFSNLSSGRLLERGGYIKAGGYIEETQYYNFIFFQLVPFNLLFMQAK